MEAHLVRRVGETHLRLWVSEAERTPGAYRAKGLSAAAEAESLGWSVEAQGVGHVGLQDLIARAQGRRGWRRGQCLECVFVDAEFVVACSEDAVGFGHAPDLSDAVAGRSLHAPVLWSVEV